MGDMEIPDELIDQLLGEYQGPEQLTGPSTVRNVFDVRPLRRFGCPSGGSAPVG